MNAPPVIPSHQGPISISGTPGQVQCEKCTGAMHQTKVHRLPTILVVLGHLFLVPVYLFICMVVVALVMSFIAAGSQGANDPNQMVRAYSAFIVSGGMLLVVGGSISLPCIIIGLLLTMKKAVWRCGHCGFFFDRI